MIKFLSLSLRNFLSYGNNTTVISLERPGTTLILGEDLDNTTDGRSANGVGKTTLINAVSYACFDKAISDIGKDNLINNINKKHMEVSVDFEKNGVFYRIYRARKMKSGAAGNFCKLYRNEEALEFTEEHDITPDSVDNTNKLVEQVLGFPYEVFSRVVIFSASQTPFLDLPFSSHYGASQTGVIENLFGLTILSEKADHLKEQIKESKHIKDGVVIRLEQLQKEHEHYEEQLLNAKRRVLDWEKTKNQDIVDLEHKLDRVLKIDVDEQKKLHDELVIVEKRLSELTAEQIVVTKELKRLAKEQKGAQKDLTHLQDDKCPYCLQDFHDAKTKIKGCEKTIESTDKLINESLDGSEKIEAEILALQTTEKKLKGLIVVDDIDEVLELKSKIAVMQDKIKELQKANNPFLEPLEELEKMDIEEVDYDEVNELQKTIDHQNFLLKLLTKKDSFVRKVLLNKYLPFLNSRLSHYLLSLGMHHIVQFTHELKCEISQFGRGLDFGNLSAGQRARVNIALSFAFRDVLQSLHSHINICLFDEILDIGLDTIGVQKAAKLLKKKARDEGLSLYIISHRDELGASFDNAMIIQMEKGFSYVRED